MNSRFNSNPSADYRAAVDALRKLPEGHRDRAYADACHDDLFKGFKNSRKVTQRTTGGHVCVNRLKGSRRRCYGVDCPEIPDGDHLSEWKRSGTTVAILSQPYGLGFDGLRETLAFCDEHGLQVTINTYPSFHFPSTVISLIFTQKGFYLS